MVLTASSVRSSMRADAPGEEGVDGYDAGRADDDVAVDDQKAPDRPHVEDRRPVDARDELPIVGDDQHGGQRHAEILGDDRAVTDAGDAHPAAEGEEPRTADMDDVLQNGDPHGMRAFCIPMNQPLRPKSMMPAGTAQMRA